MVRVLDAPGPSGYQPLRYRGTETVPRLPEIDAVVLQSRATLEDFFRGLMAGGDGKAEVFCLDPRVPKLRKLVQAKAIKSEIAFEREQADGGDQGG
jgi:hypothetical protein